MGDTFVVRAATLDDLPAVTQLLADAFLADPVMSWVFPHNERHQRLRALFGFLAEHVYLPSGLCGLAESGDGQAIGTSLWRVEDPDQSSELTDDQQAAFFEPLSSDLPRLGMLGPLMAEHHPVDPHHYLLAIGTDPAWQSKGVGSALGAWSIASIREAGTHGYLEATSQRSRALYLRWGFEVISEFAPDESAPMWGMWLE